MGKNQISGQVTCNTKDVQSICQEALRQANCKLPASIHPDIVKKMEALMKSSHTPSEVFTFSAKAINE